MFLVLHRLNDSLFAGKNDCKIPWLLIKSQEKSYRKKSQFWLGKKSQLGFVSNMFGMHEPIVADF